MKIRRKCACGCGQITSPGRGWVNGHNRSKQRLRKKFPREYNSWRGMRNRCNNPNASGYHHYGGKGIKICIRWRVSFKAFLEDMGRRPKDKTIDRIDNDGNYTKDNCQWATDEEQALNCSKTKLLLYKGKVYSVPKLAKIFNISDRTMRRRIRNGEYRFLSPSRAY